MGAVQRKEVYEIMAVYFEDALLSAYPHFTDRIWALLHEAERRGKDLSELYEQLNSALFQEARSITRGTMIIEEKDGLRHVYLEELEDLADALLEPIIGRYSRTLGSFEKLNAFAMRYTSLTALKYLCVYYEGWASPMNIDIYRRVIRENFEPAQYEDWLRQ